MHAAGDMLRLIPPPLQRALMPLAHRVRHSWRRWRKAPIIGCSIVIVDGAGRVLLLRHSYGPPVWSLPGGGIGRGEDPMVAARREVREELALELAGLTCFAVLEEELSGAPHTAHLFEAVSQGMPQVDRREVVEARFFAPDALPADVGAPTARRLALWRRAASEQR